jgi:hypothetical protein
MYPRPLLHEIDINKKDCVQSSRKVNVCRSPDRDTKTCVYVCGGADLNERTGKSGGLSPANHIYGQSEQSIRDVVLMQTNAPCQTKVTEPRNRV